MGRPERPIDPAGGPVAAFAARLRDLRRGAGSPSYRILSQRARFAPSVLSSAAAGLSLPTLEVTAAYVSACGGYPAEWAPVWHAAARAANASRRRPRTAGSRGKDPPSLPAQLPPDLPVFVGRRTEVAEIERWLLGDRSTGVAPVLVHGPIGCGKTALAAHMAQRLRDGWPDGQLYADLSVARSPGPVLGWFIRSLGVPVELIPGGCEQRAGLYRSLLANRRVLILLDGATSERQVRPLLPPTAGSTALITARSRLAGLATAHRITIGPFPPDDSVAMLGALVGAQRVQAERASAHRIAEICDHFPLPLWIVGARLAARQDWTLLRVLEQIRDTPKRLEWLQVGDVSVRSRLAAGYRRLSQPARELFHRLAHAAPGPTYPDRPATELDHLVEALTDVGLALLGHAGPRVPDLFGLYASTIALAGNGSAPA